MSGIGVTRAEHLRVRCVACGKTAELCPKRELLATFRARAKMAFERAGWHVDLDPRHPERAKWFCPRCSRKSHL